MERTGAKKAKGATKDASEFFSAFIQKIYE